MVSNSDWNEIWDDQLEKLEGSKWNSNQMNKFNHTLTIAGFWDLGFIGYPFTWISGNASNSGVEEIWIEFVQPCPS